MEDLRPQILELVKTRGPILPLSISSELKKDSLFVGAYLSDLLSSKQILVSAAKVGGSPLYYAKGQESRLEMLYKHLEMKEREAYDLLKKNKVMSDKGTEPAIRVAFRNLRDFAKPIEVKTHEGPLLYWKWYLTSDDEVLDLLKLRPLKEEKVMQQKLPIQAKQEKPKVERTRPSANKEQFLNRITEYLQKSNIRIEENLNPKGQEINMIVKVPSTLGELEYFLVAKTKQAISDSDLSLAYQKGHTRKLPVLFLTTGKLSKKAVSYWEKNMKGYLNFREITM